MDGEKKKQNLSKKKIINSAIMLFANKGFGSTTTREICSHAGVNLSLIPYYFGNKEGLYIHIIESIVNYGLSVLHDELEKARKVNEMSLEEKINLYRSLLEKYADFLYSEQVPNTFVILMVKEQTVSNSKFREIYFKKINILYASLRKILASILGIKEDNKNVIFEVSSIIARILGYKLVEKATLNALRQDAYTKADNKKIKDLVFSYINDSVDKIRLQVLN